MFRSILVAMVLLSTAVPAMSKDSSSKDSSKGSATVEAPVRQTHEQLQAVLWVRSSVEYQISCAQAYALATMRVDEAMSDKSWTAACEQTGDFHELPPAVVLDVDETVLDNSTFQVRLVSQNIDFSAKLWDEWVAEESAIAVPGVKSFIASLEAKNVEVFYVTNRDVSGEAATVKNLSAVLGMPVDADHVLCKNEQSDWTSNKTSRRQHLSATHRLLLLIGDDFNDFVFLGKVPPQQRVEQGKKYQQYWGRQWIQLPNPLYGHWEKSIFNYDYGLSDQQKLELKYEVLGDGHQ